MNNQFAATEAPDERLSRALSRGHTIDITTTDAAAGSRVESSRSSTTSTATSSSAACLGGATGTRTCWRIPRLTFHLKRAVKADLPATARPIIEPAERGRSWQRVAQNWGRTDLEKMLQHSPLVEVTFDNAA